MYSSEAISQFIEEEVNPILALHQGGAKLAKYDVNTNTAELKFFGGCVGCPSSQITLYNGIVPALEEKFPGISVELARE